MSDLFPDLVEEILSRVPITSLKAVKLTCKQWNDLSKDSSFTKNHYGKEAKEIQVIMICDLKACLMSVNLHNHKDLADPSIKQIGKLNQVEIDSVFHCDGLLLLLLCNPKDNSKLMVWNPYLGQTRWIQPRNNSHKHRPAGRFNHRPAGRFYMGYDSNNNHKILWFSSMYREYEIYDFKSDAWTVIDVNTDQDHIIDNQRVSLKGNVYFIAHDILKEEAFLLSFDFTCERFGPSLPLPFHCCHEDTVLLSTVREEQLAVLFQKSDAYEMGIWITTKIELNIVLWSKFLKVDMTLPNSYWFEDLSFFLVDEKKKVAMVSELDIETCKNYKTYILGENGYYREVDLRKSKGCVYLCVLMFQVWCKSSKVPVLARCERK